jgi:hypothetical protein
MRSAAACAGLAALLVATAARAGAPDPPRQLVHLGAGVPVPLELYGYDPSLEGSGAEVDLLIHGRLAYAGAFFGWPHLFIGTRASISGLKASAGDVGAKGYLLALGLECLVRLPFGAGPDPAWDAGLGLGPTFVLAGFEIDAHMRERTAAFGLQVHAWVGRAIASWLRVALDVGLEHAFDPLGEPTFFNQPLGSNTILCFTLGPMALF